VEDLDASSYEAVGEALQAQETGSASDAEMARNHLHGAKKKKLASSEPGTEQSGKLGDSEGGFFSSLQTSGSFTMMQVHEECAPPCESPPSS
jgi:hypothetical protein